MQGWKHTNAQISQLYSKPLKPRSVIMGKMDVTLLQLQRIKSVLLAHCYKYLLCLLQL